MRVLVVGDDFIKGDMVVDRLDAAFHNILELEYVHHWTDWPTAPFQFNDEIGEFVGKSADVAGLAKEVDVIVGHMAPIDANVIDQAENLKAIAVTRGGPINVNIDAATRRGIPVLFVPGRNARTVAEFTVAMILGQAKRIAEAHHDLRNGIWRTDLYEYDEAAFELEDRIVGLIGYGAIGRLVAGMLQPFGVKVLVYDPYVTIDEPGVTQTSLEEILETGDFVSLHARVTPETKHLINAKTLAMMKPSAHLINTARGPLVDYPALVEALQNKVIAGAALDTFDVEPLPPGHPLTKIPTVMLTPHIAGSSKQVSERAIEILSQDLKRLFTTGQPTHCMNPEVLDTFKLAE